MPECIGAYRKVELVFTCPFPEQAKGVCPVLGRLDWLQELLRVHFCSSRPARGSPQAVCWLLFLPGGSPSPSHSVLLTVSTGTRGIFTMPDSMASTNPKSETMQGIDLIQAADPNRRFFPLGDLFCRKALSHFLRQWRGAVGVVGLVVDDQDVPSTRGGKRPHRPRHPAGRRCASGYRLWAGTGAS